MLTDVKWSSSCNALLVHVCSLYVYAISMVGFKHYNKELRVAKDEIPIVLAELNESAIAFIKKE